MILKLKQKSISTQQALKVLSLLEELRGIAQNAFALELKTHSDHSVNQFLSLDVAQQRSIETTLQDYIEIIKVSALESGATPKDIQIRCVRSALWKYGLFAKCELEDYVDATDIIEIYDMSNTQIFRNLEFLRFCSYDFLHVMTTKWFALWDRPDKVIEDLMGWIKTLVESALPTAIHLPEHMMREREAEQRAFLTKFTWFIPLFQPDQTAPAAFMSLASTREVGSDVSGPVKFLRKNLSV